MKKAWIRAWPGRLLCCWLLLLLATGSVPAYSKPSPTPEPLNVNVYLENNDASPIRILSAYLGNAQSYTSGFSYQQCVSYRNVSKEVASEVDFSFIVTNREGEKEADFGYLDVGTFTPPIKIENHCLSGRLWPKAVVKRMTDEIARVKRVTFTDGTEWSPGTTFMRAYSSGGQALAKPVLTQGGSISTEFPPARSTGALARTGRYGAIYYQPGTFASGAAVDRPTAVSAREQARSACDARSNGRYDCRLAVVFSGRKCGAIGVLSGQLEYGVGDNERDARAMVLGKIPGARIITSSCNSPR